MLTENQKVVILIIVIITDREELIINISRRNVKMKKYECTVCGYVYDPEKGDPDNGVEAETKFSDLSDDWVCPLCGVGKDLFEEVEE